MRRKNLRKKIIDAAIKLFAKKGFYETTVDDIAKAAKIAKGTAYLYFKDKPSLYISVIEEHFVTAMEYLQKIHKEDLTSTEMLQRTADEWINYMVKFKSSFPMFSIENINLTRRIMKAIKPIIFIRIEEMITLIAQIIEDGIKKKEFRKVNPRLAALYFLNTIRTGFFAQFFMPGMSVEKNATLELFFNGLKKRR
ncbi:MAG: TetR/AcrR family transcriptional regulator [Candidatus Stahlbacteria bacterium]|nr:MAG: TetR/AcrR family transcriptional regulator [Candidatus Stahlbacteria bacterium]